MKRNVGPTDRIIRIVIEIGISIAGIILNTYWGLIEIAVLATGIFGYCTLYTVLKINTNKRNHNFSVSYPYF